MSWINIKELNEKRSGILAQIKTLVSGDLSPEVETQIDGLHAEERKLAKQADMFKAADDAEKSVNEMIGRDNISGDKRSFNVELATRAWRKMNIYANVPGVDSNVTVEERAALASAGSTFVPDIVATSFATVKQAAGGVLAAGPTEYNHVVGGTFAVPTADDTSNTGVRLSAETTDFTLDVPPTLSEVALNTYTYSSKEIPLSLNFIRDTMISELEKWIGELAAKRILKIFNSEATISDGSSKPLGCVYGSTLGKLTASDSAITYAEVLDLLHSLNQDYRDGAVLMMNDNTLKAMRKLISSDGVALWGAGNIAAGVPETLGGAKYVINHDMVDVAAGAKSMLYGNFKEGCSFRKIGEMKIYNRGLNANAQIGYIGLHDLGFTVHNSAAVKHIIQPAS
jgi:HK97 family phage major capsid protein